MPPASATDVLMVLADRNPGVRIEITWFRDFLFAERNVKDRRHYAWMEMTPKSFDRIRELQYRVVCHPNWYLGFSALAAVNGRQLYIPQIDLRTEPTESGQALVKDKLLNVLGKTRSGKALPGYLLNSGKSFHYIGLSLLDHQEWLEFLGRCLLCEDGADPARSSPVDRRWIGHSLCRGKTVLRISGSAEKPEPRVVGYLS